MDSRATDPTQMQVSGERHPTIAELREGSHPQVSEHLAGCSMCQSVLQADADSDTSVPIALDLPKGLVTENAFRWPADPIARGGMAQIFAGEDKRLGRTVILKAPREGDELPAGMAEMFQRRVTAEARILAKLQHPAIVTIHELGKSTVGWPFCVLERVEGTSLRDKLDELAEKEKDGTPRTRERLELLSNLVAIAEALAYAHERRIVHRDCTPNNILLGKRGEATLIDWGIARDLEAPGIAQDAATINDEAPSMSGRMVTISAGTPPYLPFEQTQGRQADPSFDVYSFGISLYETVSGRTPFEWKPVTDNNQRTLQLVAFLDWLKAGEPAPLAMPKDRELSGIIARAIDHDAARRFTADELVRALNQYLHGELVFSHRYSLTGRLARWAARHRAITVAAAALVIIAIGGGFVWGALSRSEKQQAELATAAAQANADEQKALREADDAQREAQDAKAAADKAERDGQKSDALRKRADQLRVAADSKSRKADEAAKLAHVAAEEAKRGYEEALKVKEEAEHERDKARLAQSDAEQQRDDAKTARALADKARDQADRERDSARAGREAAERERDAAKSSQVEAEKTRDVVEKERDAAVAARKTVETERDEAKRKIQELEAKLRESRQRPPPPPPPPGPGSGAGSGEPPP
jgi:tRNA A-37 threonylcarbamoyl transferase component Bud32